jgi:hypothetical protein
VRRPRRSREANSRSHDCTAHANCDARNQIDRFLRIHAVSDEYEGRDETRRDGLTVYPVRAVMLNESGSVVRERDV